MPTCMRCLFLSLFLCSLISQAYPYQPGNWIQTPNYPNPYIGKLSSSRSSYPVNSTQGVAVVFEQFLASAHDCVIACPINNVGCTSICGDAMDHGLVPKILRIPGSALVTMVSIDENDGFPHSGISGKVLAYDLQKNSFFDCNSQINLDTSETFFLISQNYPLTPTTSFSGCSISFSTEKSSRQGIRFAVYDFYLGTNDKLQIFGKSGKQDQENLVTITGFATEDEPVVYYFENTANVTFSIDTSHKSLFQKRFYILVKSYELATKNNNCVGESNNLLMELEDIKIFGTQNFGNFSYSDNLQCAFNFTRQSYNNSMFALAIQYETEKCCDTMRIDGLSQWEEVYQGYQYSNIFFTYSRTLSFYFQSDPVVGGTGFSATIEHLDCSCPPSLTLKYSNTVYKYPENSSLSYCPNILCQPKIQYQDMDYDLQLSFTQIDLRTYSLSNNTDYLSTFDAYGHRISQMLPGYAGSLNFWSTLSPVSFEFLSNYVSAVPLNMAGHGFSINFNLIPKQYIKETVTFTDGVFFKDISNLDLYSKFGTGKTYEYTVNGRPGHQISMYFFTKTANLVFIDIFDGYFTNAKIIDNKILYSNIEENGVSLKLTTSTNKAIIRIRGNPEGFIQDGDDFQAMITDVKLGDNCNPLAYSLRATSSVANIRLQGQNCYTVLHFSDSSYSQTAFMNVWMSKRIDMNIYLGLNTFDSNRIAQFSNDTWPQDLFTSYLVLQYSTNDMINLNYNWAISSGLIARVMQPDEKVMIMSADFGKPSSTSLIQQFSVQLEGESKVQTGLQVEFLTDSGKGQSTFTWSDYDSTILTKNFSPAKKSTTFSSCGNKLFVDYTSPGGGSDNGLYLKITRADLRCSHSPSQSLLSMFLFLLVVIFIRC